MGSFDVHSINEGGKRSLRTARRRQHPPLTMQHREGLARFLKEHASPPHQRVTAGGRIVPAGPLSPPPMFNFASLNSLAQEQQAYPQSRPTGRQLGSNGQASGIYPQSIPCLNPGQYLHAPGISSAFSMQPAQAMQAVGHYSRAPYTSQQPMTPAPQYQIVQMPAEMEPVMILDDGSTLFHCKGVHYRCYQYDTGTVFERVQSITNPALAPSSAAPYALAASYDPQHQHGLTSASMSGVPTLTPLGITTNQTRALNAQSMGPPVDASSTALEENLKEQLNQIDRHLASYLHDLPTEMKNSLVAQRKTLVTMLDELRKSKGHRDREKSSFPGSNSLVQQPYDYAGYTSTSSGKMITPSHKRETSRNLSKTIYGCSTKALSPAAPAFVPRGLQGTSLEDSSFGKSEINGSSIDTNTAAKENHANVVSNDEAHHDEHDSSDPYMRIVHYDHIEYAARYLYHHTKGAKKYCTTVPEFQEAIRQVREQARLYGCLGGSSKDPAFDAEEDIWWAIGSHDPIPVPELVPDHVSNPRSWNWAESVFNYRRLGAPEPEMPPMDGRMSPRLLGWSTETTENNKTIVDVSRSYYALQGLLPSVPFRNHIHDEKGNKIPLESLSEHHSRVAAAFQRASPCTIPAVTNSRQKHSDPVQGSATVLALYSAGMEIDFTQHLLIAEPGRRTRAEEALQQFQNALAGRANHDTSARHSEQSKCQGMKDLGKYPWLRAPTKNDQFRALIALDEYWEVVTGHRGNGKLSEDNAKKLHGRLCSHTEQSSDASAQIHSQSACTAHLHSTKSSSALPPTCTEVYKYRGDIQPSDAVRMANFAFPDPKTQNKADYNTLSATSKKQWGPENDAASRPKVNIPMNNTTVGSKTNAPKRVIDMPLHTNHAQSPSSLGRSGESKVEYTASTVGMARYAISLIRPSSSQYTDNLWSRHTRTDSSALLRGFLRCLTFSPNRSPPKANVARDMYTIPPPTGQVASKENLKQQVHKSRKVVNTDLPASNSLASNPSEFLTSKAPSSLASSTYQAYGQLPQYDKSTVAETEIRRQGDFEPRVKRVHAEARMGEEALQEGGRSETHAVEEHCKYGSRAEPTDPGFLSRPRVLRSDLSDCQSISALNKFLFDGGADSPLPKSKNNPKTTQENNNQAGSGSKIANPADFDRQRPDPNNTWHTGDVEDLFNEIRENDEMQMTTRKRAKARRINNKTAP